MLDFVAEQSRRLNRTLSRADQQRMDQYLTSVRELEQRLASLERWEHRPRPRVNAQPPQDIDDNREFVRKTGLMFDVIKLALETDSSRVISLFIDTTVIHNITHHGNRPEVLAELRSKEEGQFEALDAFLRSLNDTREAGPIAARPDDGPLRHLHGERQLALERQPARAARRRRIPARPAPRVRPAKQLPADKPLRVDAATPGRRDQRVLLGARDDARVRIKHRIMKDRIIIQEGLVFEF